MVEGLAVLFADGCKKGVFVLHESRNDGNNQVHHHNAKHTTNQAVCGVEQFAFANEFEHNAGNQKYNNHTSSMDAMALAIEQVFSLGMTLAIKGNKMEENDPPAYSTTKNPAKFTMGFKKPFTKPSTKDTKATAMMI